MLSSFMKFVSGKWSNVNVSESDPMPVNIISGGIKLKLGGTDISSNNPLPVAQSDGLEVSGTATSAEVWYTLSF